jgi:hypothetical protein
MEDKDSSFFFAAKFLSMQMTRIFLEFTPNYLRKSIYTLRGKVLCIECTSLFGYRWLLAVRRRRTPLDNPVQA